MTIPYLCLSRLHQEFFPEILKSLSKSISFKELIGGDGVINFEQSFQNYVSSNYCIGVGNGFDAIRIALISAGINPGDDVLVSAHTCIPTWMAVTSIGANIIPLDCSKKRYIVNLKEIQKKITKKTKAVVLVHIYGEPIELKKIYSFLKQKNIILIDDAAQAHGASITNNKIGCGLHSDMTAWSFYPTKNLGALGDAGAITTNNPIFAQKAKMLRNYGSNKKNNHPIQGLNSRLDPIQGLILSIKLKQLDLLNKKRKKIAEFYLDNINSPHIKTPFNPSKQHVHSWHIFPIRCKKRSQLVKHLLNNNIETLIHYPTPPHKQYSYKHLLNKKLPNTEKISNEVLSLPIAPYLNKIEITHIANTINNYEQKSH